MSSVALVTVDQVTTGVAQLVGLAVLSGTVGAIAALVFRGYTRERIPTGLALLFGLSAVAVYLNTTASLSRVVDGSMDPIDAALYNIAAFAFAAASGTVGLRVGDHFGDEVLLGNARENIDQEVSRLVETVGRVIVVELPPEIDDVVGYDPVAKATKEKMAGKHLVFPRNLTVDQLEQRLVSRLKADYGVGTVDIELDDDGTVDYLAVGSRAAGIGPTLPPATNAVAIRADPAFSASTGDLVQVWESNPPRRVCTGELRAVAEDVVTVAISSSDTPKIDPTRQYRLVTLPVDDRPEREFASLLRGADETFTSVDVEAGSPLHGMAVGALDLAVIAVKPETEEPVAMPGREYVLAPGDVVFAITLPEALRRLEIASQPLDPAVVSGSKSQPSQETESTDEPDRLAESGPLLDPEDGERPGTPVPDDQPEPAAPDDAGRTTAPTADEPPERSPARTEAPASADVRADITDFDDDSEGLTATDSDRGDGEVSADSGETASDEETEETTLGEKADESTFDELKSEYEAGELDEDTDSEETPVESVAEGGDGGKPDTVDASVDDGTASFDELKSQYDSGEAEWADDSEDAVDEQTAFGDGDDTQPEEIEDDDADDERPDDLVSLDDADISLDTDERADSTAEDDLSALSVDEEEDGVLFEDEELLDDGDEGLFDSGEDDTDTGDLLEDDSFADDEEDDEETDEDDEEDEDGGGTSFAQLKEEFEEGEAEWADDISDSPGGDMRLDE